MAGNVQFERLYRIENHIRSCSKTTRRMLAEKLEVSMRTVQRDLDFMRDRLEAPLEYNQDKGFYYSEPGWRIPDFTLSERDLFSLLIARRAVALYRGTPVAERLTHIFNKLAGALSDKIDIHPDYPSAGILSFAPEPVLEVDEKVWSRLLGAIRNRRSVLMRYNSRGSADVTERRVDPYHILNMQGDWYLYGWDYLRERVSQFLLYRIASIKKLRHSFEVSDTFDIRKITESSFGSFGSAEQLKNVRLRITGDMGELLADRQFHPRQKVRKLSNGFEISFPVSSAGSKPFYNVIQWILSMGRDVEIISPQQLRTLVHREILAMKKVIEKSNQ
ncbi:MAG: WYL domain-containing protein [Kiritimatiellia bacterium]